MRGAGTSIAGNAVGTGIVVDTLKHLNQVVSIDAEARTAVVQPGVVHADLQRAAAPYGLRFGPDPSTHTRCTIGGMIGNNACGSRALGYGRTVDNVVALDVAYGPGAGDVAGQLAALVDQHLGHMRTSFGRFTRQVSGYSLEHLLPENGRNLDRFLVGSEGTLGVVLGATVRLVEDDPDRHLVVLGYPSMAEAADAVPALLAAAPSMTACEGLDSRIVDLVPGAPELPRGAGWLFVEVPAAETGRGDRRGRCARAPGGRRRPGGGGAVADPRGRCRPGGPLAVAPGVLRLGGRRRAAGEARRLAARLRRAAQGARPRRGARTATSATAACTCGSTSRSADGGAASSATSSPPAR